MLKILLKSFQISWKTKRIFGLCFVFRSHEWILASLCQRVCSITAPTGYPRLPAPGLPVPSRACLTPFSVCVTKELSPVKLSIPTLARSGTVTRQLSPVTPSSSSLLPGTVTRKLSPDQWWHHPAHPSSLWHCHQEIGQICNPWNKCMWFTS